MKVTLNVVLSVLVVGALVSLVRNAQGSTTALYLFDGTARTPASGSFPGADSYFDDGPDSLNLVHTNNFGATSLSSDIPPVATTGTSLSFAQASPMESPNPANGNFGIGATGQITIEFWYKSNLADTIRYVMSEDDYNVGGGGNGWSMHQNPPNGSGQFGIRFWQSGNGYSQFAQLDTPQVFSVNQWYHVAFTGDLNTDELKFYKDGVLIASSTGFSSITTINPKTNFPLVIGTDSSNGRGFAGNFLMDDLRFSNIALLPGNGTGVGELAWNTSLSTVPEPSSIVITALGITSVLWHRGRRSLRKRSAAVRVVH